MDSFNNNDPFKQFVKSKLADYEQEVPPSGWENLESSLFAVQKTKTLHTKWLVSTMTAVAAALIGVFFVFQNMNEELPVQMTETLSTPITTPHTSTSKQEVERNTLITKQTSAKTEQNKSAIFADNASSIQQKLATASASNINEEVLLNVAPAVPVKKDDLTSSTVNENSNQQSSKKDKASEIDEETKQRMIQDFIDDGKRTFADVDVSKTAQDKSKFAVSLSGRSAFVSSQQSSTTPTTLRSSLNDTYGDFTLSKMQAYTQENDVNPKSEIIHRQPVSFGLLASFDITKKLQIETGIIYTYLSSETKNTSEGFINSEKQQFHYLGVPVNINYTFLSVNKLNMFVTAGAMIEKDIHGNIKYNDEKAKSSLINSGYANETTSKINQKNPQLSLTSGVGITYPIYNKAHLFGKIGGRYYIKADNEFKTYYSDEKFGLDIQLGIKFNF